MYTVAADAQDAAMGPPDVGVFLGPPRLQLMEPINENLLFRWFVGLPPDADVWHRLSGWRRNCPRNGDWLIPTDQDNSQRY
jgi:hypothetical protein